MRKTFARAAGAGVLALMIGILSGCGGGSDGATGPAGSTGSTGPAGPAGASGIPAPAAPGSITGTVTNTKPVALSGVKVTVQGTSISATTDATGAFTLSGIQPGPVFISAAAPSAGYLDAETKEAVFVKSSSTVSGVSLVLSSRPDDSAQYLGAGPKQLCSYCHQAQFDGLHDSAHNRSLTRIDRSPANTGPASSGAFARLLNATLTTPRVVMVPLAGTITADTTSKVITGVGTQFQTGGASNALQEGDVLGYSANGLGWTKIGTIASGGVTSDTSLTLTANATLEPTSAKQTTVNYSVSRLSKTYTKMQPADSGDIVAPGWPGVTATNPNYDVNDPCIYGNPSSGSCAAGGSTKYSNGQVKVYTCNLKGSTVQGIAYVNDEYVQKFGGLSYSCSDGKFWDGQNTPAVPLVHIDVIYGGQGDKDANGNAHPNMGVFKQRFQGRLSDVKSADAWNYTAGKGLDSLTLPVQILESGDKANGGFKMNGYHPTEQKFPGESWTQRTRTFSHACAGCHNVGLKLDWDTVTVTIPFGRDGAPNNSPFTFAAVKGYSFIDENITCEQCHGPASTHAYNGGGRANNIINPKYLTAESQRQVCGKCHAYDDATNAKPAQDYGFEFPWNSDTANKLGGGDFIAGVYELSNYFDNWDERLVDDEALWDPIATGGKLYGQAHRQQYIMLSQSKHVNNDYYKTTCTDCHDSHSLYLSSPTVKTGVSTTSDKFAFKDADYRNNVSCLTCHASGGPSGTITEVGPFDSVAKVDVANLHVGSGGTVTKNGVALNPSGEEIAASKVLIANAVGKHMFDKASMVAPYQPLNEAVPAGRCTSCHMAKLAKSGGYITGNDANGNKAIIQGDQANHVFDIVWPWQSNVMTRGGPTFQSGWYGQFVSPSNVKYDLFGFMPNSCNQCHDKWRKASLVCPDTTTVWPNFWPFSEHRDDAYWKACYSTSTAP